MAKSTKEATAEGAKVTTVATGEHATADAPVEPETGFPLYAMRMRDFLELTRLEPHNTLAAKGLVVPVDFSGEHRGERLNFVSHQWLAYAEADPEGAHLKTMQAIFRMAIAGESIFRSEEDWNAYSKGYTAENAGSASTKHASATQGSFGDEESVLRSEAHFLASIADGWVWMDYISIPQTVTCTTTEETLRVLAEQKAAIHAIPSYVQHAQNFWICAPAGVRHADAGFEADYETWLARGWCRMEEAVLNLVRLGDGRPLLVTQPFGEPPRVRTLDKIDRAWNMTQRKTAVLTGAFSCCRLGHKVTSADGSVTPIACDKLELRRVLHGLFERQLNLVWSQLDAEGLRDAPFEERVGASMKGSIQAFWNIWTFVTLKPLVLAETTEEPDFVAEGWSAPAAEITRDDYEAFCGRGNGRQGGYDSHPERDMRMMGWNCAMMGHLPMLKYCVENLGVSPTFKNAFGMSMLMMCGRFGHARCMRYLCEHLVAHDQREEIDYVSGGLGLSAIGDAAKGGHADCIRCLVEFGAFVDPKRKNGKTPLHEVYISVEINLPRAYRPGVASSNSRDSRAGRRQRSHRVRAAARRGGRRRRGEGQRGQDAGRARRREHARAPRGARGARAVVSAGAVPDLPRAQPPYDRVT